MKEITINIFKDFSTDPWGRYISDNPISSGQLFRENFLIKAFSENDKVIVDFSGLEYVPDSSFIGEAFVGLNKVNHLSYEEILKKLEILPKDGFYPELVKRIINLARNENIII